MKKFISCFLIISLFISTTPVQIFAQRVADLPTYQQENNSHKKVEYKPAISFEYDYYEVGEISMQEFIKQLEADIRNTQEISENPEDLKPTPRPGGWGSPESLKQAYNNYLYYNKYPEESPLWNKTALIPGDGASEDDVLEILDGHKLLTEYIANSFRASATYQDNIKQSVIKFIPSVILTAIITALAWEALVPVCEGVAVTGVASGAAAIGASARVINILSKITKFVVIIAFMASDLYLTEYILSTAVQNDDRLKKHIEGIGTFRTTFKIVNKAGMMDSLKETDSKKMQEEFERLEQNASTKKDSKELELIKRYFKKGYSSIKNSKDQKTLKIALGKFLYNLYKDDEYAQKDFRSKMLSTYYALRFVSEEISKEDDPLRYDRAMFDLATIYKIREIKVIDQRMFPSKEKKEKDFFIEKASNDMISALNLILQQNSVSLELMEEYFGSREEAKAILNSIQKKGLIEEHDLGDAGSVWEIYPGLIKKEIEYLKESLEEESKPAAVRNFGEHMQYLQMLSGDFEDVTNSPIFKFLDPEVEQNVADWLKNEINRLSTYPAMLKRAEINYIVQLMDMNQKRIDWDNGAKKRREEYEKKKKAEERAERLVNFWDDYAKQMRWQGFK